MDKPKIHRTAIVDSGAKLSDGVEIGPYCIIGKRVKIGKNTKLKSHIVMEETEMPFYKGMAALMKKFIEFEQEEMVDKSG